jgi:hypothetical protein
MEEHLKPRAASDALVNEAIELVKNGDKIPEDSYRKIQLAFSLDNRTDIMELKVNMERVNNHPFHRLTPKRLFAFLAGFLAVSGIYIKESRDVAFKLLEELAVLLF